MVVIDGPMPQDFFLGCEVVLPTQQNSNPDVWIIF